MLSEEGARILFETVCSDRWERLPELIRTVPGGINGLCPAIDREPYETLLHLAVRKGAWRCVRWLLENGADPRIRRAYGECYTAWRLACAHPWTLCVKELIRSPLVDVTELWISEVGLEKRSALKRFHGSGQVDASVLWQVVCRGGRLLPLERNEIALYGIRDMERVADARWVHCRAVCTLLLARRIERTMGKDVRRVLVRTYVWPTRYDRCWAPWMRPEGFFY